MAEVEKRKMLLIRSHDQSEARCQACDAPIIWTITRLGRRMPMNQGFATKGYEKDGTGALTLVSAYADETHWATCPFAGRFRGRA